MHDVMHLLVVAGEQREKREASSRLRSTLPMLRSEALREERERRRRGWGVWPCGSMYICHYYMYMYMYIPHAQSHAPGSQSLAVQ